MKTMATKNNKTMPKWWKPYWLSLLALVTVSAVLRFIFRINQFDRVLLVTISSYSLLGFSYYVRVNPPSLRTNKMMYRGLLGFLFGWIIWIFLYATRVVSYLIYVLGFGEWGVIVLTLGMSFVIGFVLGDLVGRYRNYKGPEQYTPI
jgi:hypothetical protein